MPAMIRFRRGTVLGVVAERPGAVELSVQVDGEPGPAVALAYPPLVGPVDTGDRVLLNTTAVWLGLGTGGMHFVIAGDESRRPPDPAERHRIMKLRYTPLQVAVASVEEPGGTGHEVMREEAGLEGTPVVWLPLHSMVGPAAAGAKAAGARTVAYVMSDGAALPAGLSRLAAALRASHLLDGLITCGQAFGGDLEAVNVFSGMLAARMVVGAEVVLVADGPGNTGTNTAWGATDVASAMSLNAAAILGGRPIAPLRISFADPRERHRGISHHSITALKRVAMKPVHVAVPVLEDESKRSTIWEALRSAKLEERHQVVEVSGQPALDLLSERGVAAESMGRGVQEDPAFFLAAGAAGILAGRMAVRDGAWRSEGTPRG